MGQNNPENKLSQPRFTRRGFFKGAGTAAVVTAVTGRIATAQEPPQIRLPVVGDPEAPAEPASLLPPDNPVTIELRTFNDVYERSWEDLLDIGLDGKPTKRTFRVVNPLIGKRGFMVDFDKLISLEENDPVTFQTLIDPQTGQPKMRNTTVFEEIQRLMHTYGPTEFIFEPGDPAQRPTTNINFLGIEAPEVAGGQAELAAMQWWIKPKDHPNGVVATYWMIDYEHPVTSETQRIFYSAMARMIGDTLYYFKPSPPETHYLHPNPYNTPERTRLAGLLRLRTRPIDLVDS